MKFAVFAIVLLLLIVGAGAPFKPDPVPAKAIWYENADAAKWADYSTSHGNTRWVAVDLGWGVTAPGAPSDFDRNNIRIIYSGLDTVNDAAEKRLRNAAVKYSEAYNKELLKNHPSRASTRPAGPAPAP